MSLGGTEILQCSIVSLGGREILQCSIVSLGGRASTPTENTQQVNSRCYSTPDVLYVNTLGRYKTACVAGSVNIQHR